MVLQALVHANIDMHYRVLQHSSAGTLSTELIAAQPCTYGWTMLRGRRRWCIVNGT